jgi:hypothetical protein
MPCEIQGLRWSRFVRRLRELHAICRQRIHFPTSPEIMAVSNARYSLHISYEQLFGKIYRVHIFPLSKKHHLKWEKKIWKHMSSVHIYIHILCARIEFSLKVDSVVLVGRIQKKKSNATLILATNNFYFTFQRKKLIFLETSWCACRLWRCLGMFFLQVFDISNVFKIYLNKWSICSLEPKQFVTLI